MSFDPDSGRNSCAPGTVWGMTSETIINEYSEKIDSDHPNAKELNTLQTVILTEAKKLHNNKSEIKQKDDINN